MRKQTGNSTRDIYRNDPRANPLRRMVAYLLDALLFSVVAFGLIMLLSLVLLKLPAYKEKEDIVNEKMKECYRIEEEAKIYRFEGEGDDRFSHPVELEDLFYEYCMEHILYSYSVDPKPFETYGVIPTEPEYAAASYDTDRLAYFYTRYCAAHDVVDYGGMSPELYFYKVLKDLSPVTDMWVFDEENHTLPYLDGYYAVDLYQYLKDDSHQSGVTNYNKLAVAYRDIWEEQVKELVASPEFQKEYVVYKENYAACAYMVDILILIAFVLTYFLVWLLPQFIQGDMRTLGRRIMHIRVVDFEGYRALRREKVLSGFLSAFGLFGVMMIPCYFAIGLNSGWMYPLFEISGIGVSPFSIMGVLVLISVVSGIASFFGADKRSLVDRICSTMQIDDREHDTLAKSFDALREQREREREEETTVPMTETVTSKLFERNADPENTESGNGEAGHTEEVPGNEETGTTGTAGAGTTGSETAGSAGAPGDGNVPPADADAPDTGAGSRASGNTDSPDTGH